MSFKGWQMVNYNNEAIKAGTEDLFSGLFEPDIVLPSQFLVGSEKGIQGGERRLMAALLSDGIEAYISQCAVAGNWQSEDVHVDAFEWVETRDLSYVFSFDNVCECLGINADYLRLGLTRYVQAARKSASDKPNWKKIRRPRKH